MADMRGHLIAIVALLVASAAFAGNPAWAGEDKDPDGRYEGTFKLPGGAFGEVTFTVKGDGRSLDRFGGEMIGVCYQPGRGRRANRSHSSSGRSRSIAGVVSRGHLRSSRNRTIRNTSSKAP